MYTSTPYVHTSSTNCKHPPTTDPTFSPTYFTPPSLHRVRFAPGPLEVASKYKTQDGHPDHEGLTAKQKRSLSRSFGTDLTPQSVLALEKMLGKADELYRPSLERLKRRVGLVPLRKRNQQYITWPKRPQSRQQEEEDRNGHRNKDNNNNNARSKRPRLSLGDSMSQRERDHLEDVGSPSVLDAATIEAVFEARRLLNIKLPDINNNTAAAKKNPNNTNNSRSRSLFLGRQQPLALGASAIGNISSSTTTAATTPLASAAAAGGGGSKRLGGLNDRLGSFKNQFSSELKKKA